MPAILIVLGALAITATLSGNGGALASQLEKDFSGNPSFAYWVIAVLLIGSIGYVPGAENVATLFLVLCVVSFVLQQNTNLFTNFTSAVEGL